MNIRTSSRVRRQQIIRELTSPLVDPELYDKPPSDAALDKAIENNIRCSLDITPELRERVRSWYRRHRWQKVFVTVYSRKDGLVQIHATYCSRENRKTYFSSRALFNEIMSQDDDPAKIERRVKALAKLGGQR